METFTSCFRRTRRSSFTRFFTRRLGFKSIKAAFLVVLLILPTTFGCGGDTREAVLDDIRLGAGDAASLVGDGGAPDGDCGPPVDVEAVRIVPCPEAFPSDSYNVLDMNTVGDTLNLTVQYSGGCRDHDFFLCWGGSFLESSPVQARLHLAHDAHEDPCEALPIEDLSFDLKPLAEVYREGYHAASATILLRLDDWGATYEFNLTDSESDPADASDRGD
ncbi:MAG: hypothetical protein H6729_04855 [Deltaproteobacteria bacterium]|nr:hypothetical protein [Deltaproteobacteria bacterium]